MEKFNEKYDAIRKAMVALEALENAIDNAADLCMSKDEAIKLANDVYDPANDIRDIIRKLYEDTAAEEAKQSA